MRFESDRELLGLINRQCDTLRNLLIWLANNGEFDEQEAMRISGVVFEIDRASRILCGHMNGTWRKESDNAAKSDR